jgi:hypothetical protein
MKIIQKTALVMMVLIMGIHLNIQSQKVFYVSNGGSWDGNWDIYSKNIITGVTTRLTFNPAIDNHPDISHYDTNRIVFSSNRGNGEFDIYVANVNNIDGTAVRLTSSDHPALTDQGKYPSRHPHWHPNGQLIIFTSKNRFSAIPDSVITECSHPAIIRIINGVRYRFYEGMNILKIDENNNILDYKQLNVLDAWDQVNYPTIWVPNESVYVGHPSFNQEGNKIVFTAAIDGEGKKWEVYTAGFDPISISFIPNSLRRVTYGPDNEPNGNPIRMSGGAKFSYDDSEILFNSTRTTGGNSQLFSVPANSVDVPVSQATRLTFNHGNDYIPEPLNSSTIVFVSDLGPTRLCQCPRDTVDAATDDLDIVLLQGPTRTNIGTNDSCETLLIADEVAWFCGLKPNLSSCTSVPRIFSVESLLMEHEPMTFIPTGILGGYGPAYSGNAQQIYGNAWINLSNKMQLVAPMTYNLLLYDMIYLNSTYPGQITEAWLDSTTEQRLKKYVVPEVMYGVGLGDSCDFYSGIPGNENTVKNGIYLKQNNPNPFDRITEIVYGINEKGFVLLKVLDVYGNAVATLVNETKSKGTYTVNFIPGSLPGGIYICTLSVNNSSRARKMVCLK